MHLVNVIYSNVNVFLQSVKEKTGPFEEVCVMSLKVVSVTVIVPVAAVEELAPISGELDVLIW